jgi:O-antigen/teichoic acid export membrane protein
MVKALRNVFERVRKSQTLKAGIWYTATDFFLKGMAFITIPIYTRLLSVQEYGVVSVYGTFVSIFALITGLDLHASIGTGINDFREKKDSFLSSVLFLSLLSFLVFAIAGLIGKNYLSSLLNIKSDVLYLSIIGGYLGFVIEFYSAVKVFEQQYKIKSILSLVNALTNFGLSVFLLLVISRDKYLGRIYGDLFSKVVFSVILFIIITLRGRRLIWPEAWKYSLKISIPLILHSLSGIILSQFDRLAIQKMIDSEKVGLYSYAYNLGMIPSVVLGALNSAWVPWFYDKMYKRDLKEVELKSKYYNEVFLLFICLMYITIPELGIIMAPRTYSASLVIVPVIISSYYMQFLYTLYVNFAFSHKKTGAISVGTALAGLVNVVSNILLIPKLGYEVAAITTLASYFLLLFFHAVNVRYNLKDRTLSARYIFSNAFLIIFLSLVQYLISRRFFMFSIIERTARLVIFGTVGLITLLHLLEKLGVNQD